MTTIRWFYQSCRRLPNFGGSPEFGSFQKIAQKIAQNFCAIFKIGQKRSKKLPNATKTLGKLPKQHRISSYLSKAPKKSSRKAPEFFKNSTELFRFCHQYPKKLPKSSRILDRFQSGDSSAWRPACTLLLPDGCCWGGPAALAATPAKEVTSWIFTSSIGTERGGAPPPP